MGMFCVSSLSPQTGLLLLSTHLPFRSFVILGECLGDRTSGGLNNSHMVAG
jgi:hypothetical protein